MMYLFKLCLKRLLLVIFSLTCYSFSISFISAMTYPELGSNESLDFMTWNIENFPKHSSTVSRVADIVNEINVDIIAFQEIQSLSAFNDLISQLDGNWVGYRSGGNSSYGELAYAVNTDEVQLLNVYTILQGDSYFFAYREPYVIKFIHQQKEYVMINNHFKCCGDGDLDLGDSSDEEYRRYRASQILLQHVVQNHLDDRVIILGDLNDEIGDNQSDNVFIDFLNSDDFQFADYSIAYGPSSDWSFPSWPSHIDHILISNELNPDLEFSTVSTFKVDDYFLGGLNAYDTYVSDHRPVFMKFDQADYLLGDINHDDNIDVLDVIIVVNLILNFDYDVVGDVNYDGVISIMDVVILISAILSV